MELPKPGKSVKIRLSEGHGMAHPRKTIPQIAVGLMVALASIVPPPIQANDAIMDFSNWPNGSRFEKLQFNEKRIPKTVFPKNIATIQRVLTRHGNTIEKYSDGLIVEIDRKGNRRETLKSDHFALEAKVPSDYGEKSSVAVDEFSKALIGLASVHGSCSSRLQSRLYQFANYYLSVNEPEKAAPLIHKYFEIKREIHRNGIPLSDAEKTYLTELETKSAKSHISESPRQPEQ